MLRRFLTWLTGDRFAVEVPLVLKEPEKGQVRGGVMRARAFDLIEEAIGDGVRMGWMRAHKHVEKPKPEAIQESIEREVLNAVCERFEFDP